MSTDTLSTLIGIIAVSLILALPGLVVGFVLLMTPLRRIVIASNRVWIGTILISALLVTSMMLYAQTWLLSAPIYLSYECDEYWLWDLEEPDYCARDEEGRWVSYPQGELQLRLIVPDAIQPMCFNNDAITCQSADHLMSGMWHDFTGLQLQIWATAILSGLGTGLPFWFFIRRKRNHMMRVI